MINNFPMAGYQEVMDAVKGDGDTQNNSFSMTELQVMKGNQDERKEKIDFCVKAVKEIEGVEDEGFLLRHFEGMTDKELNAEVEWLDYLLGK